MDKILLLILFIVFPLKVFADCPERLSKDYSIALTRDRELLVNEAQLTVKYKLSGKLILKKTRYSEQNKRYNNEQYLVNGLIVFQRTSKKRTLKVVYMNSFNGIKKLPEIKEWRSAMDLYIDGKAVKSGEDKLTYVQALKETIGNCIYDVWEILTESTFKSNKKGNVKIYFKKYYSPKLNLVLRTIRLDKNQKPISEVKFDTIKTARN